VKRSAGLPAWAVDVGGVAVCLALTAAAYALGLQPLLERGAEAEHLRGVLEDRRLRVAELESILARSREREGEYATALGDQVLGLQSLAALNPRLGDLTRNAEEAGLRIDQMQPGDARALPDFLAVPIRVAGFGTFSEVVRYLRVLEGEYADIRLVSFDAARGTQRPGGTDFRLELTWIARAPAPGG